MKSGCLEKAPLVGKRPSAAADVRTFNSIWSTKNAGKMQKSDGKFGGTSNSTPAACSQQGPASATSMFQNAQGPYFVPLVDPRFVAGLFGWGLLLVDAVLFLTRSSNKMLYCMQQKLLSLPLSCERDEAGGPGLCYGRLKVEQTETPRAQRLSVAVLV
jgi:hypothetical protein